MSTTHTPESLAAEMERRAANFSLSCGCDEMRQFAAHVRALAAPVQPVTTEPEAALTERHLKVIENEIAQWQTAASELVAESDRIDGDNCPRAKAFTSGQAMAYGHVAKFLELARFADVLAEIRRRRPAAESAGAGDAAELREALRVIRDYADAARDEWSPTAAKEILIAADRLAVALGLAAPEAEVTP